MIEHNHLIIRAECASFPENTLKEQTYLNAGLTSLIKDIGMKTILPARCHYVTDAGNEGWTGNAGLATSHVAYHWWDKPDPKLVLSDNLSLVQFDLYTCGCLGPKEIVKCIEWVDDYQIVNLELMLMNRSSLLEVKNIYRHLRVTDKNFREAAEYLCK